MTNDKSECIDDIVRMFERTAVWRRAIAANFNDPRNIRAAETPDKLAIDVAAMTDEEFPRLSRRSLGRRRTSKAPNRAFCSWRDRNSSGITHMNKSTQSGELLLIRGPTPCRRKRGSLARWLVVLPAFLLVFACPLAARAASPAELVSSYRHQHGEGKLTIDPVLNRIAQEQARAMAARDEMGHAVLRPFSDRVTNLNAERAAENLAQGDGTFSKALDQWIGSYGHRSNLLMHEATRIGIASARSPKSGEIYWAMEIAGPEPGRTGSTKGARGKEKPCRLMLNDLCL